MELAVKHFEELSTRELYEIYKLRTTVFVVEQRCPYQEVDAFDEVSWHLTLRDEAGIAAYLRVLPPDSAHKAPSIGRVLSVRRRQGLASCLVSHGIALAKEKYAPERIVLEAQTYVKSLYEKLGFRQVSEEFLDEGIPHIKMELLCKKG